VALQADEACPGRAGQCLGRLGLANAGLALEQEWLLEGGGQEDGGGQRTIGQVPLARQSLDDLADRFEASAAQAAASSSARRQSTRAR
jgi:hypothetical protein